MSSLLPQPRENGKTRGSALLGASFSIFRQFCHTSTLHGTYFLTEAKTGLGKFLWLIVVVVGATPVYLRSTPPKYQKKSILRHRFVRIPDQQELLRLEEEPRGDLGGADSHPADSLPVVHGLPHGEHQVSSLI